MKPVPHRVVKLYRFFGIRSRPNSIRGRIFPNGRVIGRFRATGIRPRCAERLAASGRPLTAGMFEHVQQVA